MNANRQLMLAVSRLVVTEAIPLRARRDFLFQFGDEVGDREDFFVAVAAFKRCSRSFDFFVAEYERVRHLFKLALPNAFAETVVGIDFGTNARFTELYEDVGCIGGVLSETGSIFACTGASQRGKAPP